MARVIIPTCRVDVSTKKYQNSHILISPEDWGYVNRFSWCLNTAGYASSAMKVDGQRKVVRLHRVLLRAGDEHHVDHRNRNRRDNRRENIRLATVAQNSSNVPATKERRFKGVYKVTGRNTFQVIFNTNGRATHIGNYKDQEEAARAYDAVAWKAFGEFAGLNFPHEYYWPTKIDQMNPRYWSRRR